MAREHSFTITLSNNRTEKAGLQRLLDAEPAWILPDKNSRREILEAFGLPKTFSRAFDLVWIKGRKRTDPASPLTATPEGITLIELKTTRKNLPDNPHGFFFGATENEFALAKRLGDSFRFCFVCLHDARSEILIVDEAHRLKDKAYQYFIQRATWRRSASMIVSSFQSLTSRMIRPRRGWRTTKSGCMLAGPMGTSNQQR